MGATSGASAEGLPVMISTPAGTPCSVRSRCLFGHRRQDWRWSMVPHVSRRRLLVAKRPRRHHLNRVAGGADPWVAVEGDTVTLHYLCKDEEGQIIDSSRDRGEPVTFEVGAGEVTGNPLYQAFDSAIRGLPLGNVAKLEATGGEWNRELLFQVPRSHQEIERLEGRYKSIGGIQEGMIVELANGASALVVKMSDDGVTLDANNMMAGKTRVFELELVGIEPGGGKSP